MLKLELNKIFTRTLEVPIAWTVIKTKQTRDKIIVLTTSTA